MINKTYLKSLSINDIGRDFVVGDLHGCYDELMHLLQYVKFDKSKDRLFSVGDLIDRGPKSFECFNLIKESWFYPILGNHEVMMYDYLDIKHNGRRDWKDPEKWSQNGDYWFQNGGYWYHSLTEEQKLEIDNLYKLLKDIPFMYTVGLVDNKRCHIIHAELLRQTYQKNGILKLSDKILESEDNVKFLATVQTSDGDAMVWARFVFARFCMRNLTKDCVESNQEYYKNTWIKDYFSDVSTIYSGHTIVQKPISINFDGKLKLMNLDTGAFRPGAYGEKEYGLTIKCLINNNVWTLRNKRVYKNEVCKVEI